MDDLSISIPGTDYKIGMLNYNKRNKTATFVVFDNAGRLYLGARFTKILKGTMLHLIDTYFLLITEVGKDYIVLSIGTDLDIFQMKDRDTDVLGYATIRYNRKYPGFLIFQDTPMILKKGDRSLLGVTRYSIDWGDDGYFRLFFDENEISNLKKFEINKEHKEKFMLRDGVTVADWNIGETEGGAIMYDATGSGFIDSPDDYPMFNDFYFDNVNEDFIKITPCMIVYISLWSPFKLKGQRQVVWALDEIKQTVELVPVAEKTIPDATVKTQSEQYEERILEEIHENIIDLFKDLNREFGRFGIKPFVPDAIHLNSIKNPVNSEEEFTHRLASLGSLISDCILSDELKKCLKTKSSRGSRRLLERFLTENYPDYDSRIIEHLDDIATIRNGYPIHLDKPKVGAVMKKHEIDPSLGNFGESWIKLLNLFLESLTLLKKTIE